MFVRIKKIKGKPYAYAVENSWTPKGTRQKVSKYLGRVTPLARVDTKPFAPDEGIPGFVDSNDFPAVVKALTEHELSNHEPGVEVDITSRKVRHQGKDAVIQMNEGFLSAFTLGALLDYKPGKDNTGKTLAELILAAGLKPESEIFVYLYEKSRRETAQKEVIKEDFYY